ncbi:hypothetical protein DDK01_20400 [Mycobacteroides abscessus]|uniref:hypothetical protein n=1 Tax=Mycobacteroides abscessus TaxID=36809 RepID=UPI000D3E180C|nr:hypothetical protein [Mycobacteroides abscessus]PVA92257.1 hypothetical protein DDK01_20400 [Mycobacteroides abscessus]
MRILIATLYRVLYAMAGLTVVVLSALIEAKVLDWDKRIAAYVAIGVGLLAFGDNLRLIKFKFDARERNAARARMHKPVVSALVAVQKVRPVDIEHLGVSVFGVHRRWVFRYRVFPWYEKHLKRLLRFRLSDYPPASDVSWTKGKGAIGECWAKKIRVLDDRRETAEAFGDPRHATEAMFRSLTEQQRCGFNFQEFVQTIGKYGEVLAVPIRANHTGELVGVLSLDCSMAAYEDLDGLSILRGEDIDEFVQIAANLIQNDVVKF